MAVEEMTIRLKPQTEAFIARAVQQGPYKSADDFVEEAVQQLQNREEWLADNRAEIQSSIEEGYAAAERGELLSEDEVRERLEQKKQAWRNRQSPV